MQDRRGFDTISRSFPTASMRVSTVRHSSIF